MTTPPLLAGRVSQREIAGFVAAFAAAIVLILISGGSALWTRQPWLDERCCTLYVIDATSPIGVIRNVVHGDIAPPLLHLILWTVTRVTGTGIAALRSIPLAAMGVALLFVYLALRRRFGVLASAAGVIALATHALIVEHSFEIRFYGFWVMFCAGYAWALGIGDGDVLGGRAEEGLPRTLRQSFQRSPDEDVARRQRTKDLAIAGFSVAIAMIHWFGIISLGAMLSVVVVAHGRRWREGLRLVAPSAAGIVMFLALTPLFVTQVRSAGSSAYWIPPLSAEQVKQTAWIFLGSVPVVMAAIILLANRLRPANHAPVRALLDPSLVALTACILMPVALIVISAVSKPVVWPRYGIVGILAWAPLVAWSVDTLPRALRVAVVAVFLVIAGFKVDHEVQSKTYFKTVIDAFQEQLAVAQRSGFPIVFQSYFLQYPVDGASRRASVTRFLEIPDSTIKTLEFMPEWQRRLLIRDRNMVRVHEKAFGFPVPITQAALDTVRRFYLFAADDNLPAGYQNSIEFGKRLFPHHQSVRVSNLVTLFQRTR